MLVRITSTQINILKTAGLWRMFTDKESTEEWLAHAYSFLGGYNLEVSNMLNTITNFADDIYFGGNSLDAYKTFKTGTYDESYRHSWGDSYKGIRQASIFIQNIDMNTKYTEEERADMKAQARFVRAYYYWLLLRNYVYVRRTRSPCSCNSISYF